MPRRAREQRVLHTKCLRPEPDVDRADEPNGQRAELHPDGERDQYILQERVSFAPVIDTPHGPTQPEIRLMFVWTDRLRPVLPLIRMGRGKMMGVDHNKGLRWVGASAGLMADDR